MAANSIFWKLPDKFSFFSRKLKKKVELQAYVIEFRRLLPCDSLGFQEVCGKILIYWHFELVAMMTGKTLAKVRNVYKIFCLVLQVSNGELLHGVVGLYDTCLPDITPEVLYSTVGGKWAKTLVFMRSLSGTKLQLINLISLSLYYPSAWY